ncbi:Alpha/Beta hydrolase protein [Xylariales sp. PMI_506]|nr:Alpha/Beta hydrolase protein [Xylariales sp. PMI_506]
MRATQVLLNLAVFCHICEAGTQVVRSNKGPTGFEVNFVFTPNATQNYSSVLLGGFPFFSDPLHASASKTNGYSPYDWKSDYFSMRVATDYGNPNATLAGLNMTRNNETGDWEITVPLPSGTWLYGFYPDCEANWKNLCKTQLVDPSNLPIEKYAGDQLLSAVQIPFDPRFQTYNYDWQLPLDDGEEKGNVSFHSYYSPGSTYPSTDIHDVGVYLPPGYNENPNKTYPVLFLSNGGQGSESDWFQQGRAHSIMDRLIATGQMEPTVLICPNFYYLGFTFADYQTNATLQAEYLDVVGYANFFNAVRDNFNRYLFPWVAENFRVSTEQEHRAFGGLALGGTFALTMLFNSTANFSSYAIMSPTPGPVAGDPIYAAHPGVREVGIYTGAGFYDNTFSAAVAWQAALDQEDIGYLSHYPMNGAHQWSTWQQMLYVYLRDVLWRPTPYNAETSRDAIGTLSNY